MNHSKNIKNKRNGCVNFKKESKNKTTQSRFLEKYCSPDLGTAFSRQNLVSENKKKFRE